MNETPIKKICYSNQVPSLIALDYVTKNMKTNYTYLSIFTWSLGIGYKKPPEYFDFFMKNYKIYYN